MLPPFGQLSVALNAGAFVVTRADVVEDGAGGGGVCQRVENRVRISDLGADLLLEEGEDAGERGCGDAGSADGVEVG